MDLQQGWAEKEIAVERSLVINDVNLLLDGRRSTGSVLPMSRSPWVASLILRPASW